MEINTPLTKSFNEVDNVGVAISFFGENFQYSHLALIYLDESECNIFDIAAPARRKLRNKKADEHPYKDNFVWLDLGSSFSPPDKVALIALLMQIIEANSSPDDVNYGFDTDGSFFNPETGEFIKVHPGQGVTCATLIMEVFDAAELPLIDRSSWPKADSASVEFQKTVIEAMKRNNIDDQVVQYQISNIGNSRYLPEQVAAATQAEHRPSQRKALLAPSKEIRDFGIQHAQNIL